MIWYVYTLANYVLVEADSESEAIEKAQPELEKLRAEKTPQFAHVPIEIKGTRLATSFEIDLMKPYPWPTEQAGEEPKDD